MHVTPQIFKLFTSAATKLKISQLFTAIVHITNPIKRFLKLCTYVLFANDPMQKSDIKRQLEKRKPRKNFSKTCYKS
jgi:hypothetical protein